MPQPIGIIRDRHAFLSGEELPNPAAGIQHRTGSSQLVAFPIDTQDIIPPRCLLNTFRIQQFRPNAETPHRIADRNLHRLRQQLPIDIAAGDGYVHRFAKNLLAGRILRGDRQPMRPLHILFIDNVEITTRTLP